MSVIKSTVADIQSWSKGALWLLAERSVGRRDGPTGSMDVRDTASASAMLRYGSDHISARARP